MALQLVEMAAQHGPAGDVEDMDVCEFRTVDLEMFPKKGLECNKDCTDALLQGIYFMGVLLTCESSNVGMWSTIVSMIFHGLLEDFVTGLVLMNEVLFLNDALHRVYECF